MNCKITKRDTEALKNIGTQLQTIPCCPFIGVAMLDDNRDCKGNSLAPVKGKTVPVVTALR